MDSELHDLRRKLDLCEIDLHTQTKRSANLMSNYLNLLDQRRDLIRILANLSHENKKLNDELMKLQIQFDHVCGHLKDCHKHEPN